MASSFSKILRHRIDLHAHIHSVIVLFRDVIMRRVNCNESETEQDEKEGGGGGGQ